jgi:hypothetical protein
MRQSLDDKYRRTQGRDDAPTAACAVATTIDDSADIES